MFLLDLYCVYLSLRSLSSSILLSRVHSYWHYWKYSFVSGKFVSLYQSKSEMKCIVIRCVPVRC